MDNGWSGDGFVENEDFNIYLYFRVNLSAMKKLCPRCKSDYITTYSRLRYFVKTIICAAIILGCYLEYKSLRAGYLDSIVVAGVVGCLILSGVALCFGVSYLIKGIFIKETNYYCNHCKHKFKTLLK